MQDRYYESLGKLGSRRIESIEANVLDDVPGVRAAIVIENDTNVEDADGRPPNSFETVVLGGLDEDIAMAIFRKKVAVFVLMALQSSLILTIEV